MQHFNSLIAELCGASKWVHCVRYKSSMHAILGRSQVLNWFSMVCCFYAIKLSISINAAYFYFFFIFFYYTRLSLTNRTNYRLRPPLLPEREKDWKVVLHKDVNASDNHSDVHQEIHYFHNDGAVGEIGETHEDGGNVDEDTAKIRDGLEEIICVHFKWLIGLQIRYVSNEFKVNLSFFIPGRSMCM